MIDFARGDDSAAAAFCILIKSAKDSPTTPSDPTRMAARRDTFPQSIVRKQPNCNMNCFASRTGQSRPAAGRKANQPHATWCLVSFLLVQLRGFCLVSSPWAGEEFP